MTKLATALLGTAPKGVSNLLLGMTLEEATRAHRKKVGWSDATTAQFKTSKLDSAELHLSASMSESKLISFESFVEIPDDGEAKAKLAALKKELTAELTKLYGKPDKERERNCPYWNTGDGTEIYMLTWRARGDDDLGILPKESIKLGLKKVSP